MPAPSLLPEQAARVRAGKCGCGCGEKLPPGPYGSAPLSQWYTPACRQKGHRQRTKAGAVVTMDERRRRRLLAEAEDLDGRAAQLERQARELLAVAKGYRAQGAELRARADGQIPLIQEAGCASK